MTPLFVGRFQPFHNGHLGVVKKYAPFSEKLLIGIGSSQLHHTKENPFTAEERKKMIQETLEEEGIRNYEIHLIPDINDPPNWVEHVASIVPGFDLVVARNDFTLRLFKEKNYRVEKPPLFGGRNCLGREIRKRIARDEDWQTLVPKPVARIIREVDGVNRIKALYME
ncbi:MAG TPA: nicotinamide-nucleotide adenylyltransferase [Thermoplasmatales archaeon]|nr:nicotinamide-nucleotide adenylyltransferase [Thermoplasmatales archaeon]